MNRVWMRTGGGCLAAALAAVLAGCGERTNKDDLLVKLSPRVSMRFVRVPALNLHVGKYEVNNAQYRVFAPSHASGEHQGLTLDHDAQPAVQVSWDDARRFCEWMTRSFGDGRWRFRLPTNAEWETIAGCGQGTDYPWGSGPIPKNWNYYGKENPGVGRKLDQNDGFRVAAPVQKSGANAWGLHGVGGNVWEWCEDADDEEGKTRVLKGASWADCEALFLKISRRSSYTKDYRSSSIGFRVLAEPIGGAPAAPTPGAAPAP